LLDREEQRRRLQALDDLTLALRRLAHEYANRMQVLQGLHELGDDATARRFLAEMVAGHEGSPAVRVGAIDDPVVAGTVVALMRAADRRCVGFELDPDSRLGPRPSTLGVLDLVTIVANCVGNALDAAAEMVGERRRIRVTLVEASGALRFSVRDWGAGAQGRTVEDLTRAGVSTKPGHHGMGLTLVREAVEDLGGRLALTPLDDGLRVSAVLPWR
jgi:sensor histidine kinase regulating citrate/malate metabolism